MRMSEANEPIKIPNMMPKEIVAHLDKYIIGQDEAKKSIAIAIRNRYRRSRLPKEMQEEILADFTRGTYITAFQEGAGVPLLKQKNGDAYQPIFTDIIEFGKFNAKNQFKAIAVTANKIPSILVKEAKGVVVNPFGVNLQMPITKRTVPNPEAAAQAGTPEEVQATQVEVKADSERAGAQEEAEAENKTEN